MLNVILFIYLQLYLLPFKNVVHSLVLTKNAFIWSKYCNYIKKYCEMLLQFKISVFYS